ncbi:MAG: hypothetical protein B9S34_10655 [Opitutia bacterium Tous-C1TDCM]|nr:MAG: hypothetical protein B9S34_10655 [Opitutae bacterium Tous-C1TDCM]
MPLPFFPISFLRLPGLAGLALAAALALPAAEHPNARERHALRGKVEGKLADDRLLLVKHEDIPGFMPAMTMAFRAPDPLYHALAAGTVLTAEMFWREDEWWLDRIRVLPAPGSALLPEAVHSIALLPAPGPAGGFRATLAFTAPAAGRWKIEISGGGSFDVLDAAGRPLSAAATSAPAPEFTRAAVFRLAAGTPYTVVLRTPAAATVDCRLTPAAAAP